MRPTRGQRTDSALRVIGSVTRANSSPPATSTTAITGMTTRLSGCRASASVTSAGVMNPTALKAAAKTGFPREKMVGVWWSGAEEDTVPAGDAAKGFTAAGFNVEKIRQPELHRSAHDAGDLLA